jgi:hypothetical protein
MGRPLTTKSKPSNDGAMARGFRQFSTYLIKRTKLRERELRVVIETVVVQNNPSITDRARNGGSIADSQWALWGRFLSSSGLTIRTLVLGLDLA